VPSECRASESRVCATKPAFENNQPSCPLTVAAIGHRAIALVLTGGLPKAMSPVRVPLVTVAPAAAAMRLKREFLGAMRGPMGQGAKCNIPKVDSQPAVIVT